jgi:hypothetical protein
MSRADGFIAIAEPVARWTWPQAVHANLSVDLATDS